MKTAVLISGLVTSNHPKTSVEKNINRIRRLFPNTDFYFGTWKGQDKINDDQFFFEEPEIKYHPYKDIPVEHHTCKMFTDRCRDWYPRMTSQQRQWSSHHTKQIIGHAYLLKEVDEVKDYDVIARFRYDTMVSKIADFEKYLQWAHTDNVSHGFSVTKQKRFDDIYHTTPNQGDKCDWYMLDQGVIHPRERFDIDVVLDYHNRGILHPAEWGWAQVLSRRFNGVFHYNHHGYVNHDKNVLSQFFYE